ncbi:MAG: DeoR/GlpR family DNA-binding transcription regulator [Actinomycetota bacterium]
MSDPDNDPSQPILFQQERQREIVTVTLAHGRAEVGDLADRFGVTTETIRRDLSDLQSRKLVRRVHGGAVPWETSGFEPLLSIRSKKNDEEKRRLAIAAVQELPTGGSVIIDSGSTLTRFARAIPGDQALRVVTNSLDVATNLAEHDSIDVIVIGGKVRKNTLAMVDAAAVAAVQPLRVDTLFISTDAASPESGLTTPYRDEAALKSAMIAAARRVVALVDHTKFGDDHFARFARWSDIDVLLTNRELDPRTVEAIEATGTTVRLT